MRLTHEQKMAVLANRPGATLVRLPAQQWGAVWFAEDLPRRERWCAQLLKEVVPAKQQTVAAFVGNEVRCVNPSAWDVWWTGSTFFAPTRRAVLEQLRAEALL